MDLYQLFIQPYESYQSYQIIIEILATLFGLISVYFSIKKNIWVYPTGIISTGLYVYILFVFGLLGDSLINVYYTIMSIYGWILWSQNSDSNIINVSYATSKEWKQAILLFIVSIVLVGTIYYFKPYLDNNFSMIGTNLGLYHLDWANWLDIFITALLLIGMWLMAKRRIENWIFWIIADVISIPMYIYKGLGITSLQYLVFTIMAIIGYREWKKSYLKQLKN